MKKGKLLIISGFSGVGKGTVVKYIKRGSLYEAKKNRRGKPSYSINNGSISAGSRNSYDNGA